MTRLAREKCEACHPGTPPVTGEVLQELRAQISSEWEVEPDRLHRRFEFPDFVRAFSRASAVALIAESAGHHPDIKVGWGYLDIELTTHAIGGISRNDFIVAARIDALER